MKNIVLIGFMGSGKTSLSKLLAKQLNRERISIDEQIEEQAGQSIATIFKEHGEVYFRQLEASVVAKAASQQGVIIDAGGGVVTNPENMKALKHQGIVYFLDVTPETVYQRLKNDHSRPLLQVPDPQQAIRELLNKRLPLYQQAADVVLDANDPSLQVPLVEILKKV